VRLERDFFPEGEVRGGVLGPFAERLAFLWAIDAAEEDALRALVVQDFESVAVEDTNVVAGGSHPLKRQGPTS
jgi:hypothetical protein